MNATAQAAVRRHVTLAIVLMALLACIASPCVLAASEGELPDAEVILDKYVKATGGQAAYDRITNRITRVGFEIPGQNMKVNITVYAARPNKTYVVVESSMFVMMSGTSDGVVWETSTMQGAKIKKGSEKTNALRDAIFDKAVYWRKAYKKAECTGIGTVADKPCYKIAMTPHEGTVETFFFDQASNLLVKIGTVVENPNSPIPIPLETFLSDYREVDGILIAHKLTRNAMGQEQEMIVESVEHNAEMPEDRFALPGDIQALIDQEEE